MSPTNRGEPGTKYHVVSDERDTPLTRRWTGAYLHDSPIFEEIIDAIPAIRCPSGQRRTRPTKSHADKADDVSRCRRFLHR